MLLFEIARVAIDALRVNKLRSLLTTLGIVIGVGAMIAAVSLLVGGIEIMNIMLVSVTERTREIGIRKALGATRGSILLQFLTEAVVLCACGGLIGVAVGMGAASELHRIMGWRTAVDFASIAMAFGFAAFTGLVFGVWPTKQASKLNPIEGLRFE